MGKLKYTYRHSHRHLNISMKCNAAAIKHILLWFYNNSHNYSITWFQWNIETGSTIYIILKYYSFEATTFQGGNLGWGSWPLSMFPVIFCINHQLIFSSVFLCSWSPGPVVHKGMTGIQTLYLKKCWKPHWNWK